MKRKTMIGLMAILMLAGMVVPAKATQVTSSSDQNSADRETLLMEMPYEPLPEENFEFDEESRTITAYTGTAVDVIIPRTIGGVPVENISYNAFSGNEAMKEIHIRSGVERLALSAFAMLPAIETICLEGIDPNVMETNWVNLQNSELTILVPEDTTDEQMEAIGKKFLSSLIITDLSQVKRGTCSMPDDPMPDIAEILSAYGI